VNVIGEVDILRQGPQAWNEWRKQNPSQRPLLAHLALSLSERQWGPVHGGPINLRSAILPDASLRFASLLDADLQAADLTRADLVHARLNRANLSNAILKDAVLDHADFAEAELGRAVLTGASLKHARNLTQSQIENTIGDPSTSLPDDLEMPAAWRPRTAPRALTKNPTSARPGMMIVAAAVCTAIAIFWAAGPQDQTDVALKDTNAAASSNDTDWSTQSEEVASRPQMSGSQNVLTPASGLKVNGEVVSRSRNDFAKALADLTSTIGVVLSAETNGSQSKIAVGAVAAWHENPSRHLRVAPSIADTIPPLPHKKPQIVTGRSGEVSAAQSTPEILPALPLRKPNTVEAPPAPKLVSPTVPKPDAHGNVPTANKLRLRPSPTPNVLAKPSHVRGRPAAEILAGGL
jgi:hypothetical protein